MVLLCYALITKNQLTTMQESNQNNLDINVKFVELTSSLNNLTSELRHYVNSHESHKAEQKERIDKLETDTKEDYRDLKASLDKTNGKVEFISTQMPLLNDMKESQKMMTRAVLSIAGAIIVMVIVGGLLAFKGAA